MSRSYEEQLQRALAMYREQRLGLAELQRNLSSISCTASNQRRTVEVTVGHQGELTALTFHTGAYKQMAPAELSAEILAACDLARAKAQDEAARLLQPMLPPGLFAHDLLDGTPLQSMAPPEP